MRDYINIGPSPSGEDCAQVGSPDYHERVFKECRAFKKQLIRQFGEPPMGTSLAVKGFPHDFGMYHEVVCLYESEDEESRDYAFKLESEMPEYWDEEAKAELNAAPSCSL